MTARREPRSGRCVRLCLLPACAAAVLAGAAPWAQAKDAEIVLLIGKGDARESATADWRPAAVKQQLAAGAFVRTGEQSQMGLLLSNKTQIRLNQLSILNIKVVGVGPPPTTQMDMPRGRAWSQAKPGAVPAAAAAAGAKPLIQVNLPAGTATVRGTDWELIAEPDGTSIVTVMSGEIEFHNEHGRVNVLPNEQARAVPGKAPVKILLTSAAERIQWVTAYRPQPRRWVKDGSGGIEEVIRKIEESDFAPALSALPKLRQMPATRARATLLLADVLLFNGQSADAIAMLSPLAEGGRGDPMAAALLARAYLVAGRLDDARQVLERAGRTHAGHVEVLLAQAEYARLQGDADGARRALRRAIEIEPDNAEAWYGIGRIETEREYVAAARDALKRAIQLRPDGPGYQGELGTLETFSNEFRAAEKAFRETLERHPDDYVALTGLGVLQLKRGETEAALESFLKAGVIEPRYARAWVFTGAAYYQLGEQQRALEAFAKAASLDEKDPLPHLVRGMVHYDALELGKAIEAAREAQARMPFVKSLNQVLTDQKGNANVGSALAAFGMEEWSQAYAYDSYSAYWAGSHLFLSDRFSGTFNKNSELFKGFLTDPSVFGASNRFSSLVPVPGHYGTVGLNAGREYLTDVTVSAAVNGYSVSGKPFSYFLGADYGDADSPINSTDADGRMRARVENFIMGLGLRASHEVGLFAFANHNTISGGLQDRMSGLTADSFKLTFQRYDVGLNYKFTPVNQAWFKVGTGSDEQIISGSLGAPTLAATARFSPLHFDTEQHDVQWRQTFDLNPRAQVSWGLEYGKTSKPFDMLLQVGAVTVFQFQENEVQSGNAYVSGRFAVAEKLDAQLDLHYQDTKSTSTTQLSIAGGGAVNAAAEMRFREWNPRVGLKWSPSRAHTLRFAAQLWRRPAGVNTLGPVDTMGIPLDDRIEEEGGRLKRARLQHEITWGKQTFAQWFLDWKEVDNPRLPGVGVAAAFELDQLERLRNRQRSYTLRQNYLEDTPEFAAGRIRQFGLAANRLITRDLTAAARYVYADTENSSAAFGGRKVPFHPDHYVNLALNWQPYARWVVGPAATYRSSRFRDEANTELLTGGWSLGVSAYWESTDKRWSVTGLLDQVHSDKKSNIYRHPVMTVQGAYRF